VEIHREQQAVRLDLSYAEALTLRELFSRWDFIGILEDEEAWNDEAEERVFRQLFASLSEIVEETGTDRYGPAVSAAWQATARSTDPPQ